MHFDLVSLLLGFLLYGLFEFTAIFIVVRFYPEKVGAIQAYADSIFRHFASPRAFVSARSATAVYGTPAEEPEYNDEAMDDMVEEEGVETDNEPPIPNHVIEDRILPQDAEVRFHAYFDAEQRYRVKRGTVVGYDSETNTYTVAYSTESGGGRKTVPAAEVWELNEEVPDYEGDNA